MSNYTLDELELYSEKLYKQPHTNCLADLDAFVKDLSEKDDCFNKCFLLLHYKQSSTCQMLACTLLLKLIQSKHPSLTPNQLLNIQHLILTYLSTNHNLQTFVNSNLIESYCFITKVGWWQEIENKAIFQQILPNLNPLLTCDDTQKNVVALKLLSQMVSQMNLSSNRGAQKDRKVCIAFRDNTLMLFFNLAVDLLRNIVDNFPNVHDCERMNICTETLNLLHNILSYEFIESVQHEQLDESTSLQLPTPWKKFFVEGDVIKLLMKFFKQTPDKLIPTVVGVLVQLSSVRRSLFNNQERSAYLHDIITSIILIITSQRMTEVRSYHELSRLLCRLKVNFQLGELIRVHEYQHFIDLVCHFTLSCLKTPDFPSASVFYLLSFWQKLVAPIPYIKTSDSHLLDTHAPRVFEVFLRSRIESVSFVIVNKLDNPLEDFNNIIPQLELISTIGRHAFEKSCACIFEVFTTITNDATLPNNNILVSQGCLSWLVLMMAAVVGGRTSYSSSEQDDMMDGQIVCRMLKLMNETDSKLQVCRLPTLELSYLYFFEQFKKVYVGDQVHKTFHIYKCLDELMSVSGDLMMLELMVKKILVNLSHWSNDVRVVDASINLLNSLTTGHSTARKLLKLQQIQLLLTNHSADSINMLACSDQQITRLRSRFYCCLGNLVVIDCEQEELFDAFIKPLEERMNELERLVQTADICSTQQIELLLVRVSRDLRGVSEALHNKTLYMHFFHWIFPHHTTTISEALHHSHYNHHTTTPVLKLFKNLCNNKLSLEVSSPNGILLFKLISRIVIRYGEHTLSSTENVSESDIYTVRLKSLIACLGMLQSILAGNYVNFAVFGLYNDPCLQDALQMFVRLVLSLPHCHLMDFPKLKVCYFAMLDTLSRHHCPFLVQLDPVVFKNILYTLSLAIQSLDWDLITVCCSTIDNLATHLFKQISKQQLNIQQQQLNIQQQQQHLNHQQQQHLNHQQQQHQNNFDLQLLQPLLVRLLSVVVHEECRNMWALSRPLLVLIILNQYCLKELVYELVLSGRQVVSTCVEALMNGIEGNITNKNRDRFTLNLSVFKQDIQEAFKSKTTTPLNHTT